MGLPAGKQLPRKGSGSAGGAQVDSEQQHGLVAEQISGMWSSARRGLAGSLREVSLPLYVALVRT